MVVMEETEKSKQFLLNPSDFTISSVPLVSHEIVSILQSKHIELSIDVFDTDHNNTDKPTIVFIHGNSSSKKAFVYQIECYTQQYRVIAFDLIGHGESSKISEMDCLSEREKNLLAEALYNPCTMIAGINQLCELKGVRSAHFVGWSLGGHIAYGLAVENPQMILSITTIGSPPIKFSSQGLLKGFNDWFVNTIVPEWVSEPRYYTVDEAERIALRMGLGSKNKELINDIAASDPRMRKYLFYKLMEYDVNDYSRTILDGEYFAQNTQIPLCLIAGENDDGINTKYIAFLSGKLVNKASRVVMIKNAPHAVLITHAKELCHIIDSFISNID